MKIQQLTEETDYYFKWLLEDKYHSLNSD